VPARCWEGNEEGVALRIDLDTTAGGEHPPQDLAVLGGGRLRRACATASSNHARR
jgi:hypothetical protein